MKHPGNPVPPTTGTPLDAVHICDCGSLGEAHQKALLEMQQHVETNCISTYAQVVMAHGFILGIMMQLVPGLIEQVQETAIVYEKLIGTPEGARLGGAIVTAVPMEDV